MNASPALQQKPFLRLFGVRIRRNSHKAQFWAILLVVVALLAARSAYAATYTVTDTADNASDTGSIRYAVNQVNTGSGGDTINFSGVTGTITLSSTLAITESVTINGPGANVLAVSGNDAVQVFSVASTATNSVISGLTITHGKATSGAGIQISGTFTVNNCTFSYNTAAGSNAGAAIEVSSGALTVNSSTFYSNMALPVTPGATADGGAIYAGSSPTIVLNNSTLYNNSAGTDGGAIFITLGSHLTIQNSTMVGNTAGTNGGGIYISGIAPTITNSIISGNTATTNPDYACTVGCGTVPAGNLIGNATVTSSLTPLQYNGGPTETMLPLASGTGIIGAGLNSTLAFDQRGIARPTAGASDLGSVQSYPLTVTTTDDSTNTGTTCTGGDTCSLRDAITLANTQGAGDVVTLTDLQGTIALGSPLPDVTADLNIVGPGANIFTISGGNAYGVFNITNTNAVTSISGVTIANGLGSASTDGAGISNSGGQLSLSNCAFTGNKGALGLFGGGLANLNPFGTATVMNCTFSGNSSQSGGAIFNEGTLIVTNSTFNGNSVPTGDIGGGIYNQGSLLVYDSTVSGNSAGAGSGIVNQATSTISNSIVAGNTSSVPGDDCNGCGTQNAFNLIATTSAPITAAQLMLGPLTYNGLNQTVQTMLPFPGSPAIQAGDPTQLPANLTTDERLLPRTINSKLDLGAVETNYTGVQFVQQPSNTTVNLSITPAVTVSVTESGTTVANVPVPITFAGTGTLNGTLTQSTAASATPGDPAVASFDDLSGDTAGTGDTLTATLTITPTGVTPAQTLTATSDPFDILALIPTTVTFSPTPPTTVVYGSTPITLDGTVTASGTPTGQPITYQVTSGPGSITGSTLSFTGVGTVAVTASTPASGSYDGVNVPISIIVTSAPLTVTVGNATRAVGAADPTFTSTANGLVNGDTLGGTLIATYSTTATLPSPAGPYSISAMLSGTAVDDYSITVVDGTLTVTALTSTPIAVVNTGSPIYGQPVAVTVTVPTVDGITPTGTVTIYYLGAPVGTGTLGPDGSVVVTIPGGALPVGTDAITVGYGGDGHYGASTSGSQSIIIAPAPDFSISSPTGPQTVLPGQSATYTVLIPPVNGAFNNVVTLSATDLPAGATATFSPASVTPGANTATTTLTIQTANQTAEIPTNSRSGAPLLLGLLLPLFSLKRGRRKLQRYGLLLLFAALSIGAVTGLTGCSPGGFFGQAPQTYTVTVTGTSGSLQHSTTVSLKVQ